MGMTTRPPETCLRAAAMGQMRTLNWYVFVVVVLLLFVTFFSCCQLTHSLSSCPWCPEEEFCLCGDVVLFGQKERYCCFPWIFQSRVMGGNRCYQLQQRKEEAVDLRFPLPNSWWWIHMSKTTLAHFCSLLPTSGAVEVGWTLFCFPSLVVLILPYSRNLLSFAGDVWHG